MARGSAAGVAWTAANPLALWDGKLDAVRAHFGRSWSWSEIAEWTAARANTTPALPRWQVLWAIEFLAARHATAGAQEEE